jgi:hypothetical protein
MKTTSAAMQGYINIRQLSLKIEKDTKIINGMVIIQTRVVRQY